jgi:hypothetical protein
MDLSEVSFAEITRTRDLELLNVAVYGDNLDDREAAGWNPLLNADQIRYLWYDNLPSDNSVTETLFDNNPNFPEDILLEIALSPLEFFPRFIEMCVNHPNATGDVEILLALKLLAFSY